MRPNCTRTEAVNELVSKMLIGFQIDAGETDAVFVTMNRRGADKLLRDKFTLGGDAGVMAGPEEKLTNSKVKETYNA